MSNIYCVSLCSILCRELNIRHKPYEQIYVRIKLNTTVANLLLARTLDYCNKMHRLSENRTMARAEFPGAITRTLKLDGIWRCSFARKIIASHPCGRFLDATKGSFAFHVNNGTMWHRRQPAARAVRVNKIKFHPVGTAAVRHVDLKDYSPFPHSCHLISLPV